MYCSHPPQDAAPTPSDEFSEKFEFRLDESAPPGDLLGPLSELLLGLERADRQAGPPADDKPESSTDHQ